jgi:hypothetical protein
MDSAVPRLPDLSHPESDFHLRPGLGSFGFIELGGLVYQVAQLVEEVQGLNRRDVAGGARLGDHGRFLANGTWELPGLREGQKAVNLYRMAGQQSCAEGVKKG